MRTRMHFRDADADFIPTPTRATCGDAVSRDAVCHDDAERRHVASFAAGHSARADDDGLRVYDDQGRHVCTFHKLHAVEVDDDGWLHIFRHHDRARDSHTLNLSLSAGLREINRRNAEFWAARGGRQ